MLAKQKIMGEINMDIEKRYRRLEDTMEIMIKNITEEELFHLVDPIYETPKIDKSFKMSQVQFKVLWIKSSQKDS